MDLSVIITQLVGGAIGGFASGKTIKESDLGAVINMVIGAIGGLGGGALTAMIMSAPTVSMDIGALVAQFIGGGLGGVILQVVVGLIKNKMLVR